MAGAYSEADINRLKEFGEWSRVNALLDIRQMHLSDFGGDR